MMSVPGFVSFGLSSLACQYRSPRDPGYFEVSLCLTRRYLKTHQKKFNCRLDDCSQLDGLDFVIYLEVDRVEVTNQTLRCEWLFRRNIVALTCLQLVVKFFPFLVEVLSLSWLLFDSKLLLLLWLHLQGVLKSVWINLFQNCLQGNERLLKDLVPVILGEMHDDRH